MSRDNSTPQRPTPSPIPAGDSVFGFQDFESLNVNGPSGIRRPLPLDNMSQGGGSPNPFGASPAGRGGKSPAVGTPGYHARYGTIAMPDPSQPLPRWAYHIREVLTSDEPIKKALANPPPLQGTPALREPVCTECIRRRQKAKDAAGKNGVIDAKSKLDVAAECKKPSGGSCQCCKDSPSNPSCVLVPEEMNRAANVWHYLRRDMLRAPDQATSDRRHQRLMDYSHKFMVALFELDREVRSRAPNEIKSPNKGLASADAYKFYRQTRKVSYEHAEKEQNAGRGDGGHRSRNVEVDSQAEWTVVRGVTVQEQRLIYFGQYAV